MSDDDRTVQVPVSLIERAERFDRRGGLGFEVHAWLRELRALIAQPTSTVEPRHIEGMAPGTVLRGKVHGQYLERTLVATGDCYIDTVTRIVVPLDLLDPASVRHITPPPGGAGG